MTARRRRAAERAYALVRERAAQPATPLSPVCRGSSWVVYVVYCADASLYVGISNDLAARLNAHNAGRGARYTRSRGPVVVVWQWQCGSSEEARRLEGMMKGLRREQRLRVVDGDVGLLLPIFAEVFARMSARARGLPRARAASRPAALAAASARAPRRRPGSAARRP
ncbi:MAG: GIY-YIG nuclease family protein [Deltaproteobacteria bacterium]|nr:GIY-YIG nuclease family protein [Deltaproteobacteria bacterium]